VRWLHRVAHGVQQVRPHGVERDLVPQPDAELVERALGVVPLRPHERECDCAPSGNRYGRATPARLSCLRSSAEVREDGLIGPSPLRNRAGSRGTPNSHTSGQISQQETTLRPHALRAAGDSRGAPRGEGIDRGEPVYRNGGGNVSVDHAPSPRSAAAIRWPRPVVGAFGGYESANIAAVAFARKELGRLDLPFLAAGTFGILGMQLAFTLAQAELTVYSGCGRDYPRTGRRPQAGRLNYCPDCGERTRSRDAQREFRRVDREILGRRDKGGSISAIASEMDLDRERIRAAIKRREKRHG